MPKKGQKQGIQTQMIYLPVEEEPFLNLMDEPFIAETREPMDLVDILLRTLRFFPLTNFGDSERAHDILVNLKNQEGDFIEFRKDDFDWMMARIKEHGHKIWLPAESVHIYRHLENVKMIRIPTVKEE